MTEETLLDRCLRLETELAEAMSDSEKQMSLLSLGKDHQKRPGTTRRHASR